MRQTTVALLSLFSLAGPAHAQAAELSAERFFEICDASSVEAAKPIGDQLGWTPQTEEDMEGWKAAFSQSLQMQPSVVGWRQGDERSGMTLNYWTAKGDNGFRACAYWGLAFPDLEAALVSRYGKPQTDSPEIRYWSLGQTQVAASTMGQRTYVNIGVYDRPQP